MLHAVIMAGGSGTRFWPASRSQRPKQFLSLVGEETLLQSTDARLSGLVEPARTWVVTNRQYAAETSRQLPRLPASNVVCEPCGRNTAPCIGLAALMIAATDPDAVMLVMPADHSIGPVESFRKTIEQAVSLVDHDPSTLVLIGVRPSYPSVSFGYIERGPAVPVGSAKGLAGSAHRVASFREKPDRQTAEQFVAAGQFFWNSGIFVWKASTILQAIARFEPEIAEVLARLRPHVGADDWQSALEQEFPKFKAISIDYAVLERADNVTMIEAAFDWDDVGSWQALGRPASARQKVDSDGNSTQGLFCGVDTHGCIVRGSDDHLIAAIGMSDCIIVQTPDATLIARKDDEESIRRLVQTLRERGYERFL